MDNETIEQFLARGGKIARVEEGTRAISSDRRIYAAMREGTRIASDEVEAERRQEELLGDAENAAERRFETFVGARFSGASISEALDSANHAANRAWKRRYR